MAPEQGAERQEPGLSPQERARQTRTGLAQTSKEGRWEHCVLTSRAGMVGAVSRWLGSIDALSLIVQKLQSVQIENAPAIEVIERYDSPQTLFYCDPPYPHKARGDLKAHGVEMTEGEAHGASRGPARRAWRGRHFGTRKVVAPFNQAQEDFLGSSNDPYVGTPVQVPRMLRDDSSKKDMAGWNRLLEILERVESRNDPDFTVGVFRQVLREKKLLRQQGLRFVYALPPWTSLDGVLHVAVLFLENKLGGDRALARCGALFDAIGIRFGLYASVTCARINASDEAIGQAADLECLNAEGRVALAVEVKDRKLTLADVQGANRKSRRRAIQDIFFTSSAVTREDQAPVSELIARAFNAGQNGYVFDFFGLARSVLALGGYAIRITFLRKVGEYLDTWNTQPANREAWKNLLELL